ncbi:hypothetical protein Pelo_1201 [Pelomyxa schiedti]|nr:hypothetical protein Pelo_1201 [Pelomyxa schiedti]
MWAGNIHTLEQLKSFQLRLLIGVLVYSTEQQHVQSPPGHAEIGNSTKKSRLGSLACKAGRPGASQFPGNAQDLTSSQPPYVDPIPEKIVQELQGKQPTAKLQKKIASHCAKQQGTHGLKMDQGHSLNPSAHPLKRFHHIVHGPLRRVCCCGHALDPHDTHLLSCKRGGLQIRRHDAVVNLLYQLAKQAGVTVQKEVSNETEGRIDRLVEDNPPPQILDISIVCPNICPAHQIPKSLDNASKQEQRKWAKWLPRCSDRYVFTPVCWESTGAPTELTCSFVNSLISVLDDKEFEPPNWACRTPKAFWWDKLYTSIINNTAAHLRRVTTNTAP